MWDPECLAHILGLLTIYYPQPSYAEDLLVAAMNLKPCEAARVLKEVLASKLITDRSQRDALTYPSQRDVLERALDVVKRRCAGAAPPDTRRRATTPADVS